MCPRGALAVCALLLLSLTPAFGTPSEPYLAELVARSKTLGLAKRPEWLKLLHYEANLLSPGVHGLVDSRRFYNAADGKSNPQAELEATLASFFSNIREANERQNPQCAFVARFAWLDEQLAFDAHRLARQQCMRYQQWHASLDPAGLTLIFASAYLNSPASMYGHTFLRIDAKDQNEQTRLLAYAVNFAANTNETNGIAFAFNGLFGGYPGAFSIQPYYIKIREYSDLENRDIWEYELNLSPQEIDRVVMHMWELGPVSFPYFFVDENCSYQLLGLLQVARPDLELTRQFRWWAIPSDTVRAVTERPDLVKSIVYRPANATVIRYELRSMGEQTRRWVKDLSLGRITVDDLALHIRDERRQAAVIETSEQYVNYRRAIGKTDVADPAGLDHELLEARSRLDVVASAPQTPTPQVRPDQGHGSSRLVVGAGRWDGEQFQEVGARGAYHDIMDADGGYVRGAQTEFLNVAARHYNDGATRIENFVPLDIVSLSARDEFFQPISWSVETGWQRVRIEDGSEPLVFAFGGGVGASWSNERDTALFYALFDASTRVNSRFDDGYDVGAGASFGALIDATPRWRIHAFVRGLDYLIGQHDTPWKAGLQQRIAFGRDLALCVDFDHEREFGRSYNNGSASMLFYF